MTTIWIKIVIVKEEDEYEEQVLSKRELNWKNDALELGTVMLETYAGECSGHPYSGELLDKAFVHIMQEKWWKRPRKFMIATGLGYALGQYLVKKLGFKWIVYNDYQGRDIAVKHVVTGIVAFPISAVRKRLKSREYRFMEQYIAHLKEELKNMKIELPKLHYVSQSKDGLTHLDAITNACKAGCRWVQLRMKDVPLETYIETAIAAKAICQEYQALLTINDNPQVALAAKADGLHLGKEDMKPSEARKIVGEGVVIGGTANTWEDVLRLSKEPIDYIGLGPFRYTATKEKLSPILGKEGYQTIINRMYKEGIELPVFAIGGIALDDIEEMLSTGVFGIAVSGLVTNAADQMAIVAAIQQKLIH